MKFADLRGANLLLAEFRRADLREVKLQGTDMSLARDLTHIYLDGAWLDRTRIRREQLGGAIGEERARLYSRAKRTYLILKNNFESLGDYDAASWAYRKERRMEKWESFEQMRVSIERRKPWPAIKQGGKALRDEAVQWICDYGEGFWNVVVTLLFVLVLFAAVYGFKNGVVGPWQPWRMASHTTEGYANHYVLERERIVTHNVPDLFAFSLGTMTTMEIPGLEAQPIPLMRVLMPLQAAVSIILLGLLGFVAGNRIRRS